MKNVISKIAVCLVLTGTVVSVAHADDSNFKKKHPRRAEVLGRANHEEKKNNSAAVNGQITDKQARKLDREDQRIKRQEQRDAHRNGGTITKGEQNQLNREENGVNRQRTNMENRDAAKAGGAPAAPSAPASAPPPAAAAPAAPATTN